MSYSVLHIAAEFNRNIRNVHALFRELMAFEVIVQQTDRQGSLRLDVLPDDEIDRPLLDHSDVALGDVVHNDMYLLAVSAAFTARYTPSRPAEVR